METVFESRRGWPMMTQFTWFVGKQQALGGTDDLHRCGLVRLRVVAGSRVLCPYDLLLVWPSQEFPFSLTPSSIYLIQVMMHISFMVLGMKPSLACNAGQGLYNELHPTRILKFTYVRDFFVSVLMFSFLRCLPVHSSFLKLACPQFPEFFSIFERAFSGFLWMSLPGILKYKPLPDYFCLCSVVAPTVCPYSSLLIVIFCRWLRAAFLSPPLFRANVVFLSGVLPNPGLLLTSLSSTRSFFHPLAANSWTRNAQGLLTYSLPSS